MLYAIACASRRSSTVALSTTLETTSQPPISLPIAAPIGFFGQPIPVVLVPPPSDIIGLALGHFGRDLAGCGGGR